MKNLPTPSFVTEEEQLEGAKAILAVGDSTTSAVEKAVPIGDLLIDSPVVYSRVLTTEEDVLYQIFRGPAVSNTFWGRGDFGLQVLRAAEEAWPMDKPKVDFEPESVRCEAEKDDPREHTKYPPTYYGAYTVRIPGVMLRPVPPNNNRLRQMLVLLDQYAGEEIRKGSNGGS